MENPRIYFAASIRGGRQYAPAYGEIIRFLQSHGQVYTEHIGNDETISLEFLGQF